MYEQPAATTPETPPRQKGPWAGITSLVIGLVSLLLAFVPIVNTFAFFTALIGLGFGIVGLLGRRSGKGMAVAGVIIAVLSVVGVIASQALYSSWIEGAFSENQVTETTDTTEPNVDASQEDQDLSDWNADPEGFCAVQPDHDLCVDYPQGDASTQTVHVGSWITYQDGLKVQVASLKPHRTGEWDEPANTTAVKVTVKITNGANQKFDANIASVTVSYGTNGEQAEQGYAEGIDGGFEGSVASGQTKTATFLFAVPKSHWDNVSVEVAPGFDYDSAIFTGVVR